MKDMLDEDTTHMLLNRQRRRGASIQRVGNGESCVA
jgi:hypothetical protein